MFNEGMTGRIKIMIALGFKIGHFTVTSAFKANYARIKNAEIKSKSYTLEARRASKMRKKATNEHFAELEASRREEKLCDNTWILDSGASCHMAKEYVWFKNISLEMMNIYLADKNSKMMSQGTGNVSAKTELIGELLYLANRILPDISFVTSYLSQFNHNREKRHYSLAKRVLRYLMGSKDKKLFYEKEFITLNASSDPSWGNAEN
ncbi:retrovirus-related Pol polyprotein from transposon TNT 1-94 [Trichonephila clavipes]|nr:retrovirus-related Pol polyprotein from transposon TNT 1-94 [Trichonephila clavipes]